MADRGILSHLVGQTVVVDTASRWMYIGTYAGEDGSCVILEHVDAYDSTETTLTRHEYLRMVKQDGIVPNRRRVTVLRSQVVAVTLLSDIIEE